MNPPHLPARVAPTRPQRIAVLASWRFPVAEPFAGGLESHVWHLCRRLTQRGHQVTLVARHGSDPSIARTVVELEEGWVPTEAARRDVSMPDEAFLLEHHAYLSALSRLEDLAVDVVHNHAYHYLPLTLGGRGDTPWVSTLHTPPTPWLESALAARGATTMRFTTVSQFAATQWSRLPVPPAVVRNGIDPGLWPEGPGGDTLVWSGRITAEKAPHLAIGVAERLGMPLVLAGPVSDEGFFEERVRPHLGGLVTYAGHLRRADLAELVGRSAAALVTPLWDEPFGQVAAEAMMCGTPVAALGRGGLPEVLGPGAAGQLAPGVDADAVGAELAAGVDALAAATLRAVAADRRATRADAEHRLGLEAMVDGYERVYSELAAGSPAQLAPLTVTRVVSPTGPSVAPEEGLTCL